MNSSTRTLVVLLPGPDTRAAGGSVRSRNIRAATRAGAEVVTLEELYACGSNPAVLVPPRTLINPGVVSLAAEAAVPTRFVGDADGHVVAGPASALARLDRDPAIPSEAAPAGLLFGVATPKERRRAMWALLRATGKPTDGWISRNFNRPISRVVSVAMLSVGLGASHASLLALSVGIASAVAASFPGYWPLVWAGVFFHLASVLDGVDGEMARCTITESEAGAKLDLFIDRFTYLLALVGITIGWTREGGGLQAVAWVAFAVAAVSFSLLRGGRFVARHAPNAPSVFINRAVHRAARDSGRTTLRVVARGFDLLRRDVFALLFMLVTFAGVRAFIPALVVFGVLLANVTFSRYRRELATAAAVESLSFR